MELDTSGYVGLALSVFSLILFILKLVSGELISGLIKKIFTDISEVKADTIASVSIILTMALGFALIILSLSSPAKKETPTVVHNLPQKTKEEVFVDAGKILLDEIQEATQKQKTKKDSLKSNRKKLWVIKFGLPIDNKKAVINRFKDLIAADSVTFSSLQVFNTIDDSYFFYLNQGLDSVGLSDSLEVLQTKIAAFEPIVEILDLNSLCKFKQRVIETKSLNNRKIENGIRCFSCD